MEVSNLEIVVSPIRHIHFWHREKPYTAAYPREFRYFAISVNKAGDVGIRAKKNANDKGRFIRAIVDRDLPPKLTAADFMLDDSQEQPF